VPKTGMAGRVLVAVKRVVDYNARIRVKPDKVQRLAAPGPAQESSDTSPFRDRSLLFSLLPLQTGVDLTSVKFSMNPFCEVRRLQALSGRHLCRRRRSRHTTPSPPT
jgi:hypothetical protein